MLGHWIRLSIAFKMSYKTFHITGLLFEIERHNYMHQPIPLQNTQMAISLEMANRLTYHSWRYLILFGTYGQFSILWARVGELWANVGFLFYLNFLFY